MIVRRCGPRRARALAAVLVATVAAVATLAAPTPGMVRPVSARTVAGAVSASAGAAQARVAPLLRAVRAVPSHRHGPQPLPATAVATVEAGLVAVLLLLAVVAARPARRRAGASRVRAPPAA